MAHPPREIAIKRYLAWRFYDPRNKKEVSHKKLRMVKNGENIVVIDGRGCEYIARLALGQVFSMEEAQTESSEVLRQSTRFDGIVIQEISRVAIGRHANR
jgi:polyhydroxyalkanoate synthesis regulator protein